MKNLSEEIIEVGGKEYTLFLNRKGLVAWERETKDKQEQIQSLQNKYQVITEELESTDKSKSDDPFEGLDKLDELGDIDKDTQLTIDTFKSLYWIMLYTHHKMSKEEVEKWFDEAIKEYGVVQLMELGNQMLRDINIDSMIQDQDNLKKLKALRPTK